jgi:methylmalonyl-CoA epimerase
MMNTLRAQLGDLVLGIDHVALAVEDIDAAISRYSAAPGFSLMERSAVNGAHSGMVYAVLKSGGATVVLVQGTSPESQVSKFLVAFGTGMHHIAFAVSDLDAALAKAKEAGTCADTPVISGAGIRQAFLQRDAATGVRIELIERLDVPFSKKNAEGLFRELEARNLY